MADTVAVNIVEVTPTNLYEAQHSSLYLKAAVTLPATSTAYDFGTTDSTKFKVDGQDAYLDGRFAFDGSLKPVKLSGSSVMSGGTTLGAGKLYTTTIGPDGYILTNVGVS